MGSRGRTSSAAIAVIGPHGVETIRRPEPPEELTDEQATIWRMVVNRLPADWFPAETHGLLMQYCRCVIRCRRLAELIDAAEKAEDFDAKEYRDLLRSEEQQSQAMTRLSTKMRINQQSSYDKSKRKPAPGKRPWDTETD